MLPPIRSAACFAALLGSPQHGRWLIAPSEPVLHVARVYREHSLVLDTTFSTASGFVTVTDCMPIRTRHPDVVRLVHAVRGRVRMRMEFIVRFDYGSVPPWVTRGPDGLTAIGGPVALHPRTSVPLRVKDWTTTAEFDVIEGDSVPFVLTWYPSNGDAPASDVEASSAVDATEAWWRRWSVGCTYEGEWREAVVRSTHLGLINTARNLTQREKPATVRAQA